MTKPLPRDHITPALHAALTRYARAWFAVPFKDSMLDLADSAVSKALRSKAWGATSAPGAPGVLRVQVGASPHNHTTPGRAYRVTPTGVEEIEP